MALLLKQGVRLSNLQPQMLVALIAAVGLWADHGVDCLVTSANDSQHREGSLHYAGCALDLRTKNLPGDVGKRGGVVDELRVRLGQTQEFDVLFEYPGEDQEHCHVEYQPKGA